jgi:hypothetical protein
VLALVVVLASMMVFTQGCASIVAGGPSKVQITSDPSGAMFTIYNKKHDAIKSGTTPAQVKLKKGAGYFSPAKYTVKFEQAGYRPLDVQTDATICGWYWGNFLFGGLIGFLAVDPLTGAMWTIDDVHANMEAAPHSQATENSLGIMTIDQVPQELRPRLVRIN